MRRGPRPTYGRVSKFPQAMDPFIGRITRVEQMMVTDEQTAFYNKETRTLHIISYCTTLLPVIGDLDICWAFIDVQEIEDEEGNIGIREVLQVSGPKWRRPHLDCEGPWSGILLGTMSCQYQDSDERC
eukprot:jgi/Botrbrau1/12216/Bobra.0197s0010.2